jgi:hypothetical protein
LGWRVSYFSSGVSTTTTTTTTNLIQRKIGLSRSVGALTAVVGSGTYYLFRFQKFLFRSMLFRSGFLVLSAFSGGTIAFALYTLFSHKFPQLDHIVTEHGEYIQRKALSVNGGLSLAISGNYSNISQSVID